MQIADYLNEQAAFLDLHKSELNKNRNMDARQKDEVFKAQRAWAERFMKLAEMIQDDDLAAAKRAKETIKKENKELIPNSVTEVPLKGMDFF